MIHELTMWDGIKQSLLLLLMLMLHQALELGLTVDQERSLYYIKFLNTVLLWPPHSFVVVQVSQ